MPSHSPRQHAKDNMANIFVLVWCLNALPKLQNTDELTSWLGQTTLHEHQHIQCKTTKFAATPRGPMVLVSLPSVTLPPLQTTALQ
mmetsp:Transcript_105279/g.177941  ORF Transcript_105279/g.177941 Transcript_105279/m.177941 type:complete len:86 (+) Transcript_105279:210-467(+)